MRLLWKKNIILFKKYETKKSSIAILGNYFIISFYFQYTTLNGGTKYHHKKDSASLKSEIKELFQISSLSILSTCLKLIYVWF